MATKDRAPGSAWDYQIVSKAIVEKYYPDRKFIPYRGDGINVPFTVAGTTVKFDVVLNDEQDNLVVIESKSKPTSKRAIVQSVVFAFWGEIECLRKSLNDQDKNIQVDGVMVVGSGSNYQLGAVKAANELEIILLRCKPSQTYVFTRTRYDPPVKGHKAQDVFVAPPPGVALAIGVSATVEIKNEMDNT